MFVGDGYASLALSIKRLVRIRDINHQTKRFAGLLSGLDSLLSRIAVGVRIFDMALYACGGLVEDKIPGVRMKRRGMGDFVPDGRKVTRLLH